MNKRPTRAQVLELPAAITLDEANKVLGIGRTAGYSLARRGAYPCRIVRIGSQYRVITSDLVRLLEGDAPSGSPSGTAA